MDIRKRWSSALCALVLAVTLMMPGIGGIQSFAAEEPASDTALDSIFKVEPDGNLEDGVYSMPVVLWNMYQDKASMGNPAINGNILVKKENGKYEYYLRMKGLSFMGLFGHLWDINTVKKDAEGELTENPDVTSWINKTFIDKDLEKKDREFPEVIKFTSGTPERVINVQVQVDAMDAIASDSATKYEQVVKGKGKQPARIIMSWKAPQPATVQEMSDYDVLPVFKKEDGKADKSLLIEAISTGKEWLGSALTDTDSKNVDKGVKWTTAAAKEELSKVIADAKAVVFQDLSEDQQDTVNEAINSITKAVEVYQGKIYEGTKGSVNTDENSGDKKSKTEQKKDEKPVTLDYRNLKDGVYSLNGEMWKANKAEYSMANNALDKVIKLTVKDGKYYIQARIKGVNMLSKHGYMKSMAYFDTGYTKDAYNFPSGKTIPTTVISYHMDAQGNKLVDEYGTDYPEYVEFPLIAEALNDGYVPLQVFVPVMEQIGVDGGNPGMGTQKCYMKLDWSSLKAMDDTWTPEKEKDVPLESSRPKLLGGAKGLKKGGLKKGPRTGDENGLTLAGYGTAVTLVSLAAYSLRRKSKEEI